jgi:formate C-acetyltransferase
LEFALNNGIWRKTGRRLGLETGDPRKFATFNEVMEAYRKQAEYVVGQHLTGLLTPEILHRELMPTPFTSSLVDYCIQRGLDRHEGGAKYNMGPSSVATGLPDVTDSLAAIKKLVFDKKAISLSELVDALDRNFEGREELRKMLLSAPKYGADDDYADLIAAEVAAIHCRAATSYLNARGGKTQAGIGSLSSNVPMGEVVGALPSGRLSGTPLADNLSPVHGNDIKGPTAVIKSAGKIDNMLATNGLHLNIMFDPTAVSGEDGLRNFASFIRTWCDLKVFHVQFNVISKEILLEAQKNPEKYSDLMVRVAGYCAFFTELNRKVQDDIIDRTAHHL